LTGDAFLRVRNLHGEVPVIGHHTVDQGPHRHPLVRLCQHPLKGLILGRAVKELHSRIAPIEDVIDYAACGCAQGTSHASSAPSELHLSRETVPDTFSPLISSCTGSHHVIFIVTPLPD